jgi:hypothetical protein
MAARKLDPVGALRFPHFSQAVLVVVPGPTLYVAGQGDVYGDFETQARKAWTQNRGSNQGGRNDVDRPDEGQRLCCRSKLHSRV